MKKYLFFVALAAFALASCSDDSFVGENSPNLGGANGDGEIHFGFNMPNATRADIVGDAAADMLGNGFYVIGTKGTEAGDSPSPTLVFDNYLVHFGKNTAGTTESNTANWEYVGVQPAATGYENWAYLTAMSPVRVAAPQTIKYWDYSSEQYDFHAFSTGKKKAVTTKTIENISDDEINVTSSKYGAGLAGSATAYTFIIPTAEALKGAYITDITTAKKGSDYGKEVKLTFKNLGSKIRLALYETVPGYAIKDVKFYKVDGTSSDLGTATKYDDATLISADAANGFYEKGTVVVYFPNVGTTNKNNANYNKASVTVTPKAAATPELTQGFGTLHNFATTKEGSVADGNYIGRTLPTATFAGKEEVAYYQVVFPVTVGSALTLRVDYTLVSTDGSGEEIKVYGAKAVVPATYTSWQPNYAYTYIFKISDNTNGWTSTDAAQDGLFPITFDAVVAEVKDVSGEQRTVTTVATPSITTYQQFHEKSADEYTTKVTNQKSESVVKDLYVQVVDNSTTTPALKGDLKNDVPGETGKIKAQFYKVTNSVGTTPISEATVSDALLNRTVALSETNVTGRNGILLTKVDGAVDATVTQIVNGVNDEPIKKIDSDGDGDLDNIAAGQVAKIAMSTIPATGTYAFVYDYTAADKTIKTFYQPKTMTVGETIGSGTKFITVDQLAAIGTTTSGSEAANDANIYFSKTTDGVKTTYSYYSVDGKEGNLPAGLLKVDKSTLSTGNGTTTKVAAGDFVFDIYFRNTGDYAVKVIKITKVD